MSNEFAVVIAFPQYCNRDGFAGYRYSVNSTHDSEEDARCAIGKMFAALGEDDEYGFGDEVNGPYVAKADTVWVPIYQQHPQDSAFADDDISF